MASLLLVDGVLLALPLGAAAYLLYKVISLLIRLLAPVSHLLPEARWFGIAALEIAAVAVLLVSRERVQMLDVPTGSAMRSMKQRGLGLPQLAKRLSSSSSPRNETCRASGRKLSTGIGLGLSAPLSVVYRKMAPFAFTGKIEKVTVELR